MKPPRAKIHLLDCSEPLTKYTEVTVRCGRVLANAEPKWMFAAGEILPEFPPLQMCNYCLGIPWDGPTIARTRYVYGLVNSQEAENLSDLGDNENGE